MAREKTPFGRVVSRTVRREWPLFKQWLLSGGSLATGGRDGPADPLMKELLRRAGCWRNLTRRMHAKDRFRDLRDLDPVSLLALVGTM